MLLPRNATTRGFPLKRVSSVRIQFFSQKKKKFEYNFPSKFKRDVQCICKEISSASASVPIRCLHQRRMKESNRDEYAVLDGSWLPSRKKRNLNPEPNHVGAESNQLGPCRYGTCQSTSLLLLAEEWSRTLGSSALLRCCTLFLCNLPATATLVALTST